MAMHPEKGSFNQYIARKTDAGWVVAFGRFADQHAKFLVVYEAVQVKAGNPNAFTAKKCDPPQEDTGFNYAAAKAIDTATHDFQGEKRPYNADVLPGHSNQIYV